MPEALFLGASEHEEIVDVHDHSHSHRPEVPTTTGCRIFVASRGAGARPHSIAVHKYFLPYHMNRKYLRSSGLMGR